MFIKPTPKTLSKVKKVSKTSQIISDVPLDWSEFASLCKIRSGDRIISFTPYEYQKTLSDCIDKHQCVVVAKTRQLGITETIANKFLHKACLNPGYLAVVLSKTQSDTSNIGRRIRGMADSLSAFVELENDSLTDLKIKGGGRILFKNASPNGVRGLESVSDILFDEAAFVDGIERIYQSAIPSTEMVGDKAKIIILSTPNGRSGFYWDLLASCNADVDVEDVCQQVKASNTNPVQYWTADNGWCKFVVHWLAHPIYSQIPDYLEQIKIKKQLSKSAVEQEYNLNFCESETNVFPANLVKLAAIGNYQDYVKGAKYYIGVDASTIGEDYTVAIVLKSTEEILTVRIPFQHDTGLRTIECTKLELVAIYRQRKHSMDYNLAQISSLIAKYAPFKVAIEVTGGTGQIYLESLIKLHTGIPFEPIKTSRDSKALMIDRVLLALEKQVLTLPTDCPVVSELIAFRRNGLKLEAPSSSHDDCVMSLAFAVAVTPFTESKTVQSHVPSGIRYSMS